MLPLTIELQDHKEKKFHNAQSPPDIKENCMEEELEEFTKYLNKTDEIWF